MRKYTTGPNFPRKFLVVQSTLTCLSWVVISIAWWNYQKLSVDGFREDIAYVIGLAIALPVWIASRALRRYIIEKQTNILSPHTRLALIMSFTPLLPASLFILLLLRDFLRVYPDTYDFRNGRIRIHDEIDFCKTYAHDNQNRIRPTERKKTSSTGTLIGRTDVDNYSIVLFGLLKGERTQPIVKL